MAEHHGHEHDHVDYPAFFEHKELVISVEHDPNLEAPQLVRWFNEAAPKFGVSASLSLKRTQKQENFQPITTLGRGDGEDSLSLLYVSVDGGNADPNTTLSPSERMEADLRVLQIVDELNSRARESATYIDDRKVAVRAASPNWLFGAAPHQLVDGGPGGRPVEPGTVTVPDDYRITCPFGAQTLAAHVQSQGEGKPRQVAVAILDAVPPQDVYDSAFASIPYDVNPLLHDTHKKLTIIRRDALGITLPVEPSTIPPAPDAAYTSHSADYEISDHGLFVAGTVHSLEPEADLLLLEVLNHYGIGTVETIAKGIEQIWQNLKPAPQTLIVNLSLCISFQNLCTLTERYHWKSLENGGKPYLDILLQPLQDALYSLFTAAKAAGTEVRIVAAAGNDGHVTDLIPPFARYPAAFDRVLGVGSLFKHVNRAPYSNLTDNPTSAGLMVFGGQIDGGNPPMSDAAGGMLGLYIGSFPTDSTPPARTPSKTGWGRWSGTSFATGVMSGLFAQAAHVNFPVAQGAGADFDDVLTASVPATPYGERFLESWQGP